MTRGADQWSPTSSPLANTMKRLRLRATSRIFPSRSMKIDGWMILPSNSIGPCLTQDRPPSRDASIQTFHTFPGASTLLGDTIVPSASSRGLFFAGPTMPFGSTSGSCQVTPSLSERLTIPRHVSGDRPTL